MAAKHFKGLRDSIIDGDDQANQLSLGIPRAVVQQLCLVRGGVLGDSFTTAFRQRVVVEYHPQKHPYIVHGDFI